MQGNDIRKFPCPDFSADGAKQDAMRKMANKFAEDFCKETLLPGGMAWVDNARHKIDCSLLEMLELPVQRDDLQNLREMWCMEPSVHRYKKEITNLLNKHNLGSET